MRKMSLRDLTRHYQWLYALGGLIPFSFSDEDDEDDDKEDKQTNGNDKNILDIRDINS